MHVAWPRNGGCCVGEVVRAIQRFLEMTYSRCVLRCSFERISVLWIVCNMPQVGIRVEVRSHCAKNKRQHLDQVPRRKRETTRVAQSIQPGPGLKMIWAIESAQQRRVGRWKPRFRTPRHQRRVQPQAKPRVCHVRLSAPVKTPIDWLLRGFAKYTKVAFVRCLGIFFHE